MATERHVSQGPARRPRRRAGAAGGALAVVALSLGALAGDVGCSLVADSSTSQCDNDNDCVFGKGLADTVCDVASHTCVRPANYCLTNRECIDRAGGQAAACVQKQCQSLLTDDCTRVLGTEAEYADDNAVFVGYVSLIAGNPLSSQGLGGVNAIELARGDFVRAYGGLPPAAPGGPTRPLVVVVCNELPDPVRPTRHLVEDLKVPVVIGPLSSSGALAATQQVTIPNEVLNISPTATTLAFTTIDDRGLVWRTDAADNDIVRTMAAVTKELEGQLRGGEAPVVAGENGLKVAYFHRGDILGTSVQNLFLDTIRFNNKTARQNLPLETYKDFDYGDFVDPSMTAATTQRAIDNLLAYQPHVILLFGLGEMVTNFSQIEQKWPAGLPYRPRYVLHPAGFGGNWQMVVGANEDLRRRILGALPTADASDPTVSTIKSRYDSSYAADTQAVWSTPAQGAYDALYLFSYAAIANGAKPLTGPNLADGMRKIAPPGTEIDASNTASIFNAVAELQAGRNINYRGAQGNIIFDANGEFVPPIIVWCVGANNRGRPTGWVLNTQTSGLDGQNTCFN